MPDNILKELLRSQPVVIDGAWGTELQTAGLKPGECPDSWNLSHPDRIETLARSYVSAGSRIILTNTFRSNRIALAGFGFDSLLAEFNTAGVQISKRAAGTAAHVFASMGSSGKMLAAGDVTEEELRGVFSEQAKILAGAGADGIALETMTDLEEALVALKAVKSAGLPVVVSMVFDSGKEKDRTMTGATPEQAAEELTAAGADVIGANCGLGIEGYVQVCARLRASTDRPIWIKPNAGLPEMVGGRVVYRTTAKEFASFAGALRAAGASFIGGCCGTTPEYIRSVVKALAK